MHHGIALGVTAVCKRLCLEHANAMGTSVPVARTLRAPDAVENIALLTVSAAIFEREASGTWAVMPDFVTPVPPGSENAGALSHLLGPDDCTAPFAAPPCVSLT